MTTTGLSRERLAMQNVKILEMMLKIRMVEEEIASRYSEQKMRCPTHLSVGQEAVPAVLSQILNKDDFAVSTHRSHAHYIAKGGNLPRMIAEIYGKKTGCSRGKGGSMHLVDESVGFMGSSAIVGNSIPIGVGIGLSLKLEKTDNISVVYFGDGATEQGVYYEALNFAALKSLPVLFVCENNRYSVYSAKAVRQPEGRSIAKVAETMGVPSSYFDGNDVSQVLNNCKSSVRDVRSGLGPRLIECDTYRWLEHCGPNEDDHLSYRPTKEVDLWFDKDPIKLLLETMNISETETDSIRNSIKKEINDAFNFAEVSPFPEDIEAYEGEYAI